MKIGIIGAGIAGLASAIRLRNAGHEVHVFEAAETVGGKAAEIRMGDFRFDAGPSLFTLPYLMEELFTICGKPIKNYFDYQRLDPVANYFWSDGTRLEIPSDPDLAAQLLSEKLGEDQVTIQNYLNKSAKDYELTRPVFLEKSLHRLKNYTSAQTIKAIPGLSRLNLFKSLNKVNQGYFINPKTVQLFNRYATYNGSNPYKAPGTLQVIPHLEFNLGAYFPVGGMRSIPISLYHLGKDLGVNYHLKNGVKSCVFEGKTIKGLTDQNNQTHTFDRVICNVDVDTAYKNLIPENFKSKKYTNRPKSSSGLIFYWGIRKKFDALNVHNLFFSDDYKKEFQEIFEEKMLPSDPTIYVHISSKVEPKDAPENAENWFVMINAPADEGQDWVNEIPQARTRLIQRLSKELNCNLEELIVCEDYLSPPLIQKRTGSDQGALYGSSSNSLDAAFLRHPNKSPDLKNLYFVGGSSHPGGGIPLCLLSAKIACDWLEAT